MLCRSQLNKPGLSLTKKIFSQALSLPAVHRALDARQKRSGHVQCDALVATLDRTTNKDELVQSPSEHILVTKRGQSVQPIPARSEWKPANNSFNKDALGNTSSNIEGHLRITLKPAQILALKGTKTLYESRVALSTRS